jgi:hypothetical protein
MLCDATEPGGRLEEGEIGVVSMTHTRRAWKKDQATQDGDLAGQRLRRAYANLFSADDEGMERRYVSEKFLSS